MPTKQHLHRNAEQCRCLLIEVGRLLRFARNDKKLRVLTGPHPHCAERSEVQVCGRCKGRELRG